MSYRPVFRYPLWMAPPRAARAATTPKQGPRCSDGLPQPHLLFLNSCLCAIAGEAPHLSPEAAW
eukprot:434989-Pelagomonas_calceolata.AAC.6